MSSSASAAPVRARRSPLQSPRAREGRTAGPRAQAPGAGGRGVASAHGWTVAVRGAVRWPVRACDVRRDAERGADRRPHRHAVRCATGCWSALCFFRCMNFLIACRTAHRYRLTGSRCIRACGARRHGRSSQPMAHPFRPSTTRHISPLAHSYDTTMRIGRVPAYSCGQKFPSRTKRIPLALASHTPAKSRGPFFGGTEKSMIICF